VRGDEHEIAAGREEVQSQDGLDRGAIDARRPGPIEVAHRRESPDPRAGEAAFETAAGPFLLLRRAEMLEQLDGAPAPLGGQRDEIVEMGGGVVQAEGLEGLTQRGHGAPPGRDGGGAGRHTC
jgi:hypothetical protein